MPSFVLDLAIVAVVAYFGWLGSDRGIFEMAALGLQLTASIGLAFLLLEPTADLITWLMESSVGAFLPQDFPFQAWGMFLAFLVLFWTPFLLLWVNLHPRLIGPGDMKTPQMIEKAGGALVGGLNGVLLLGCGLVTLSMLPFFQGLKPNPDALLFDVGRSVLRTAGAFSPGWHEGHSLVLDGEPPTRTPSATDRLCSEPWQDVDDNSTFNEGDRFRDSNNDGKFTEDLYYTDIDGNSARRIGLIEKYVVGRWDFYLKVNDRDRPPPPQAVAKAPPQAASKGAATTPDPAATRPPPTDQSAEKVPPAAAPEKKPKTSDAGEEEIVVLVDEDGNVISEEEMAEGDVEVVEEVVEEVAEEGGAAEKKP